MIKPTEESRMSFTIMFECHVPRNLLQVHWTDLETAAREYYQDHDMLPCLGEGVPGVHCMDCPFVATREFLADHGVD